MEVSTPLTGSHILHVWILRDVEARLRRSARTRPVVVLTGARQTGKTSALRRLFRHLEAAVDAQRGKHGQYLRTGSQKFTLMKGVSESLAGRADIVELETLSLAEIRAALPKARLEAAIVRGGFPELNANPEIDAAALENSQARLPAPSPRGTVRDSFPSHGSSSNNMQRLLRKFETAKTLVPAPIIERAAQPTRAGVIWYGSTGAPMTEALAALEKRGIHLDRMRIRAFPFADTVAEFIADHEHVFLVEQNRDAQLRTLIVNECGIAPDRLLPVLHYDGNPLTARFITREIAKKAELFNVKTLRKVAP